MILLKFVFWVLVVTFGGMLFFAIFGRMITRYLMRYLVKKAQQDMDRQSKEYQRYTEGYSPFEDNVFIDDDVKVSIKREAEVKETNIDEAFIEEVDFEDLD